MGCKLSDEFAGPQPPPSDSRCPAFNNPVMVLLVSLFRILVFHFDYPIILSIILSLPSSSKKSLAVTGSVGSTTTHSCPNSLKSMKELATISQFCNSPYFSITSDQGENKFGSGNPLVGRGHLSHDLETSIPITERFRSKTKYKIS